MTISEKTSPATKPVVAAPAVADASRLAAFAAEECCAHAILAAIKPTDTDGAVLGTAQWLAEHEHRELHIVSVLETAPPISSFAAGVPFIPPFHDEERRRAMKRDLRAACDRTGHTVSRLRVDVLEGSAAATIADVAREHEVRIVVVGRESHGLLRRLVYGEQVMEIIQRSRSPVLVVPPNLSVPIERAMVAFDFSMASMRAAVAAHEMLGPGGRLTLVHVAAPRRVAGDLSRWPVRSVGRRTRESLATFARALPTGAGVAIETETVHGDPVDALTAYAKSQGMQLLACGWHEHALLDRMFAESSTFELLHRAECAVLVAPEPNDGGFDAAS
jgi:nucleotide-binding universal stress UspA family protein